jgi:drug/metabolite transporter (DMT)-like permease
VKINKKAHLMRSAVVNTPIQSAKGIACMIVGCLLLTVNDALMKWLTAGYPIGEIVVVRNLFAYIFIAALAWRAGGISTLRVGSVRAQSLRAGLFVVTAFTFITGLSFLPLADAIAITFSGPLILTALAVPFLGERVGWQRWVAVFVGFIGVLLIIHPTGDAIRWAALLPLTAATAGAMRDIVTRRISVTDSSVCTLFWSTTAVTLVGLCTIPFGWQATQPLDLMLLALNGVVVVGAQFFLIEALRFTEANVAAPFKYSSMIWAVLFGFIVWGDLPDLWVSAGSILVIACGLYVLRDEMRR